MEAAVADENPSTFVLKNNGVGKKNKLEPVASSSDTSGHCWQLEREIQQLTET